MAPKKKNRNQIHQEAYEALGENTLPAVDNSMWRLIGDWPEEQSRQTFPPTVPSHHSWMPNQAPVNKIWEYSTKKGEAECNEIEDNAQFRAKTQELRRAAQCHRDVRRHIQSYIQIDMPLYQIANELERVSMLVTEGNGTKSGKGFPTGLSLNHIAAHYTPNPSDKVNGPVFKEGDIMKVDFGTQINGRIIDCAWSMTTDEKWDPLLEATKEATETGLKLAGPDANFGELATAMGEVISSKEVEIDGKMLPVLPIRNLNGHSMEQWVIHAGKSLPFHKCSNPTRMAEGEIYAIETFATVGGLGYVEEQPGVENCSHYMMDRHYASMDKKMLASLPTKAAKSVYEKINNNFSSMAFCQRWLSEIDNEPTEIGLQQLCRGGVVTPYPPLIDSPNSMTSQFEHTVWLKPSGKEVISRGPDF